MIFYTVNVILMAAGKTDLDNALLLYYEKKRGESNHHHVCVIVCCTELLRILFAMSDQLALNRLILNLLFLSAVVFIAHLCFFTCIYIKPRVPRRIRIHSHSWFFAITLRLFVFAL